MIAFSFFLLWFLYSQKPLYLIQNLNLCSKIIETKVEAKSGKELAVGDDLLCTACEMTAIWIHTQLKQNKTKAKIFEYVNKVIFPYIPFCLSKWINHWFLHNRSNILCTFLLLLKLCDNLQNPMAESAVNCDNIVNMPYISFVIGNRSFHLTPEQVWVCCNLCLKDSKLKIWESKWKKKKRHFLILFLFVFCTVWSSMSLGLNKVFLPSASVALFL